MEPADQDLVAEALPGYEITGELGRGSWGVVLAGQHRQLGRPVAIKQLPRAHSSNQDVRTRFLAEARVLASLTHPHVIPIYDYVEREGLCLLVMEQLTGGTLWERFTAGRELTPQASCAVLLATCAALQHAHQHNVLHRDVKPENVMFSQDGMLKVTDFGIAKVLSGDGLTTRAGDVLGTPAYMAPEQAHGDAVGPPADVYAAGVMLYEMLSGRLPFSDEGGAMAILYRHANEDPAPITEVMPSVPAALSDPLMRALSRSPDARFATAADFAAAVGEAATATWGPGWLERAGVPVVVASPLLASSLHATPPTEIPATPEPPAADTIGGQLPTQSVESPTSEAGVTAAAPASQSKPADEPPDTLSRDEPVPPPTSRAHTPTDARTDRRRRATPVLLSVIAVLTAAGVTAIVLLTDLESPLLTAFDGEEDVQAEPEAGGATADVDEPASPAEERAAALARSVAAHLEDPAVRPAAVTCPAIDDFVAGELLTCEIDPAAATDPPSAALVTVHDADGTHVITPWTAEDDPPDIDEVVAASGGSGQFCRDVEAAGFGYPVAVAYWLHEGQPGRMDADDDGIPCGTVYETEAIDRYWNALRPLGAEG